MQVTSMLYLATKNLMVFHTKDDKVYTYNSVTGTHLKVFDTNLKEFGHSLPEHGILRANKTEDDLFVLVNPNKVAILTKITKLGFESQVSVNTMESHPISCFKPFHYDKIITLCETMSILIHQYTPTTSKILHYLSLTKMLVGPTETHVFELCSQEKYIAVSSHDTDTGTRDKLFFLELDSYFKPVITDVMEFNSQEDKSPGSIIFDLKLDFYYQEFPILTCLELDGH